MTPRSYSLMIRTKPSTAGSLSLHCELEALDGLDFDLRARQDDTGMQHLEDESDDPREEQDRDEVRVDERVEQPRDEPGLHRVDARAGEMQRVRALRVLRVVAVQPGEQRRQRRCDRVDD